MKLLRIEDNFGQYLVGPGSYSPIDKITKEDLLRLANWTLEDDSVEFDDYDEKIIKHQAHQIIYKSVIQKLQDLRKRRQAFVDESARLFLEDYQKYLEDSPHAAPEPQANK
jgi:hypothetical protein